MLNLRNSFKYNLSEKKRNEEEKRSLFYRHLSRPCEKNTINSFECLPAIYIPL